MRTGLSRTGLSRTGLSRTGRVTRALALATCLLLVGCPTSRPPPFVPVSAGGEVVDAGESSVVVLTRPNAEGLLVQLWIDAGALDASDEGGVPELAALAAFIAETRAEDPRVHARVVPDGTVFELRARTLDEALPPLMRSLSTRDPTDGELAAARETLRERRRGRARDPLAALEAQAVSLLLGPADPLGLEPEGDHEEVGLSSARAFLGAHYGPTRARWVVVGNLPTEEVREAVLRHGGALPEAEHDAARRRVPTEASRSAAREDTEGWSIATLTSGVLGGASGLMAGPGERHASFPTPCGQLGIASARGSLDETTLRALTFALEAGAAVHTDVESDASSDAERAGLAFVARPERCDEAPDAARHAIVVAAPDHPERRLPDVDAVLGSGRSLALAHLDLDGHSALLAVALSGGSLEDPEDAHGRSAIVARALALRCGVRARVSPDAVHLEAPLESSSEEALNASLSRALACLFFEPLPTAFLEAARAEALASLDAEALFLEHAARAIAPGTPGLVAPRGSPAGLAGAADLEHFLAQLRTTERISVAVIAPFAPSDALTRGLGALAAAGVPFEPRPGDSGPREVFAPSITAPIVEVILTLRVDGDPARPSADARTVASLLARELDAGPLSVTRFASGTSHGTSWLAIGLSGPDAPLDDVEALFLAAVARVDPQLDAALALAEEAARTEREARSTRASDVARDLLVRVPTFDPLSAQTLLHAPPHRVVVRPSAPPLRRR